MAGQDPICAICVEEAECPPSCPMPKHWCWLQDKTRLTAMRGPTATGAGQASSHFTSELQAPCSGGTSLSAPCSLGFIALIEKGLKRSLPACQPI